MSPLKKKKKKIKQKERQKKLLAPESDLFFWPMKLIRENSDILEKYMPYLLLNIDRPKWNWGKHKKNQNHPSVYVCADRWER